MGEERRNITRRTMMGALAWSVPTVAVVAAAPVAAASYVEYPGPYFALESTPVVGTQVLTFTLVNPTSSEISDIFFGVGVNSVSTVTGLPSSYPLNQYSTWSIYSDPFVLKPGDVSQVKVQADLQYTPTDPGRVDASIQYLQGREEYLQRVRYEYP